MFEIQMFKSISANLAVNSKFTQVKTCNRSAQLYSALSFGSSAEKSRVSAALWAAANCKWACGRICSLQPGPAILSSQGGAFHHEWAWSGLDTACGGWAQLWGKEGHFGIRHIEYYLFKYHGDIRGLIKQSQGQTCRCVILYDPQELVWSKA